MTANVPTPKVRRTRSDNQFGVKRAVVLQTAAAMFAERGYDLVALSELADKLSITKPTLYYYVTSKDDLVLAIANEAYLLVMQAIADAEQAPGSGLARLEFLLRRYSDDVLSSTYVQCLIAIYSQSLQPQNRKKFEKHAEVANAKIDALLREGMADGSIQAQDASVARQAIFGMLNSVALAQRSKKNANWEASAKQLVTLLLKGLRADTKRASLAR